MGYSLRKGATPDFAGAEKFYNEALRIDPKHRGALEYSGELYLRTGDLARAEQRLAALVLSPFTPAMKTKTPPKRGLPQATSPFRLDGYLTRL
jgi:hypothetical protein